MDYEKKYKDAVNKLEKFFINNNDRILYKYDIESVFPELKESENEKIRKAIIEFVKQNKSFTHCKGVSKDDCLAWLEKQGEQKPANKVEPKFKVGDVIKNIDNGDTVKIEQILDNYYCYSGWDGVATIHSDFTISEQDNWELVEQKPAWSEDDFSILDSIICVVEEWEDSQSEEEKEYYGASTKSDWLKSLKERMKGE